MMNLKKIKKVVLLMTVVVFGISIMFASTNNTINKKVDGKIIKKSNFTKNTYQLSQNDFAKCGDGKCGGGKCGSGKMKTEKRDKSMKCGAGSVNDNSIKPNFLDKDTDGDGKVSFKEFTAYTGKEFSNKDKNNDGKITADECGMFDKFNTDGNDFLSEKEFEEGHKSMFNKMDANKDGFIEASEMKNMQKCGDGKCGGGKMKAVKSAKKSKGCRH